MKKFIAAVALSLSVVSISAVADSKPAPLTPFSDANILNVAYGELDGCEGVYVKDVVGNNLNGVKWQSAKLPTGEVFVTVFGDDDLKSFKPQRNIFLFEIQGEQFRLASIRYIELTGEKFDSGWQDPDQAALVYDATCKFVKGKRK